MFTQDNVLKMAKAIGAFLGEACNARDELANVQRAVRELLKGYDEEFNRINVETSSGCYVCTEGTVPDRLNTGLCAYHFLNGFAKRGRG